MATEPRSPVALRPQRHAGGLWGGPHRNPPLTGAGCARDAHRSGKSSIQRVVFHKMSPHETLFLESTRALDVKYVANNPLVQFQIWDFPGDFDLRGDSALPPAPGCGPRRAPRTARRADHAPLAPFAVSVAGPQTLWLSTGSTCRTRPSLPTRVPSSTSWMRRTTPRARQWSGCTTLLPARRGSTPPSTLPSSCTRWTGTCSSPRT